ncbi:MAG: FGGY-family carbohydrate kinase, partial [Planctomycetes bacterium]|nr:FGGY-family carbohydrate kinase [Planctomycetota bacterium]
MLFCGIDVGTQGARVIFVNRVGEIEARGESSFLNLRLSGLPGGWFEQKPADWKEAVSRATKKAIEAFGGRIDEPLGFGVTSTSGTLCVVDETGNALRPAIMYSDRRSEQQAVAAAEAGKAVARKLGYRIKSSYALPKILWIRDNEPEIFDRAAFFVSPTDFIIGWLTGEWGRTDQTNALKYGYDVVDGRWPQYLFSGLQLPAEKFPRVQTTGSFVGKIKDEHARELGLTGGAEVVAGLTDGCASQMSSGAVSPGDFNTTIGTTLVVKAVSRQLLVDPDGRFYCHRHPEGWWWPGGASNTGAECIEREFKETEREQFTEIALESSPTNVLCYPLVGRGERFPFACAEAESFMVGDPDSRLELFTSYLEGVACVERMSVELFEELGGDVGDVVYTAGGGS